MAGGRPSDYTQAIADEICERLSDGDSLREICREDRMPKKATVFRWLGKYEEFRDQYARAREEQAESMADEIVSIADEECTMVKHGDGKEDKEVEVVFDSTAVARNRLRIDARKWVAAKLKPKKYGDKVTQEHTGVDGGPIESNLNVTMTPQEAYMRMIQGG